MVGIIFFYRWLLFRFLSSIQKCRLSCGL